MWFYVDQPLFDENGQSLVPDIGVTGAIKIGVAVPEPATLCLLALGALALRRKATV